MDILKPTLVKQRDRAAHLVAAFLSARKETTLRTYRQGLDDFRAFVKAKSVDDAARMLLSAGQGAANGLALDYKADLMERKLAANTINSRLAGLRSLVKLARTLGMVPWTLDVENLRSEKFRDTAGPGQAGIRALLSKAAERTDPKGIRDYAILRLLYDLALRRGEIVSLDVDDVDTNAGTIAVLGKGRTQKAKLTLAKPTKMTLVQWLEFRGDDAGALFTNFDRAGKGKRLTAAGIYWMIAGLGNTVGIHVRPHGIRHTSITAACKVAQANGIDLEEVLDFSRHADLKTLMAYRDRERNVQGKLANLVAVAA